MARPRGTIGDDFAVDLYWLPLGAGGHSVRLNGRVYEAALSTFQRRRRLDLYHSALEVTTPDGVTVIEMAPELIGARGDHGAVARGPVGSRLLGRSALFRYEVRRWLGGVIPDVDEAVESPRRLADGPGLARRVLELVPRVPTPVWGRDELQTGEMWNSNSLISWLVASVGLDVDAIAPPPGGRAPGWDAGIVVARRTGAAGKDVER
ncbi:MAG TPA: hypothetical protein VFI83_09370 [Gaiella sp.]|nr:hypothetical protein [Gaiella sp.]